jgi:hypothetical protein
MRETPAKRGRVNRYDRLQWKKIPPYWKFVDEVESEGKTNQIYRKLRFANI